MAKTKKREDGLYHKNLVVGKKKDGSYIRKSIYAKTKHELNMKITEVTQQLNEGIMVWENGITFSELADIWFEQYNPMATEKWKYRTKSLLKCHLIPTIGDIKIKDLKQIHLQTIISNRAKEGYATSTMKKIKQTAECIMRVAINSDLLTKNPFSNVKIPVVEPMERRALSPEEIALVTDHWQGNLFGIGAMIMLYAGLRIGELLALDWKTDVDLDNKIIHVTKTRDLLKNHVSIKEPKTKAGFRDVPIPDILYNALLLVRQEKGLVCPDTKGRLMSGAAQKSAWNTFMNHLNVAAGGRTAQNKRPQIQVIERFTPHMLRHTYATMLFDAGVDVKSAQKFLGHADIEVTLAIYTHLTKFKEEQAINALNVHIAKI